MEQATRQDSADWEQLPLSELKKLYSSPEQRKFLEANIVNTQTPVHHPQDPEGKHEEMMLYWHFTKNTDSTGNKRHVGTRLGVSAGVPSNKAALATLTDGLVNSAESFSRGGKGKGSATILGGENPKGKGKKGGRTPKVGLIFLIMLSHHMKA